MVMVVVVVVLVEVVVVVKYFLHNICVCKILSFSKIVSENANINLGHVSKPKLYLRLRHQGECFFRV